jgi:hypothetical protein
MRFGSALRLLLVFSSLGSAAFAQTPACTGLCLQQVSCPNGGTTSISGTVYTPNGIDPLPGVLVYIPNAAVPAFTPGVSCPAAGTPPSGSPLVGTTTAVDGTFTIDNVPVGTNIPLVIQSGRWRRQLVVPTTTACTDTAFSTRMPRNRNEGDIPKFAIVTGLADQVECVLLKMQVDSAEFQDPGGPGRIDLYLGNDGAFAGVGGPGASYSPNTPGESSLMESQTTLNQYDVLMLPCQGAALNKSAAELSNYVSFANAGGRVYSSHYSYDYMDNNPNLSPVADWAPGIGFPSDGALMNGGVATVDTSFSQGETLAQWLQLVGATTTQGQMSINTLRHDMRGVIAPTQSWLALNDPADGNPVMQFVYNAPVGGKNQCGRVLFNEYHVETGVEGTAKNPVSFPKECSAGTTLNPQEKLLEYSLFELTNDGGQPTISPTSADFGMEPVGFQTASQSFTWTNNSTFPASATASTGTGSDFLVTSNNCNQVAGGSSCTIAVAFKPIALGARTGTLTVNSSGPSLTAALTGIGTPDLSVGPALLKYASTDVGASVSQALTVTNPNPAALPFPGAVITGDYSATTNCGNTVAANTSCTLTVFFKPSTTGDRPGTLTVGNSPAVTLDGNGIDFTLAETPASGTVIAGLGVNTTALTSPLAGFAHSLTLTCTTTAPAVTCVPPSDQFGGGSPASVNVQIDTVSKYAVIGYGGWGAGWLWMVGAGTGMLLWFGRRRLNGVARAGLLVVLLGVASLSTSGCSGKIPAENASYTPPGTYSITLSATDGFLVHTATYSLTVTAK